MIICSASCSYPSYHRIKYLGWLHTAVPMLWLVPYQQNVSAQDSLQKQAITHLDK